MKWNKSAVLEDSIRYWNSGKTRFWQEVGVPFVMAKREMYYMWDLDGHRLIDCHLNGGTYNLGHRNPEIIDALLEGTKIFDIGNHHFPAIMRAELCKKLAEITPEPLQYSVLGSSGGEAIDVALKCSRYATKRRKHVSVIKAYHGHTGLAVCTADEKYAAPFLAQRPDEFIQVPYNDLDAMEKALQSGDIASVIMETIPATYGFPMPAEGYLQGVRHLCSKYGALYIADEVQTGLMRTGKMWGVDTFGVVPDILVTAKGLSGGIYPITATVMIPQAAGWMDEYGFAHIATYGGAELGCCVALKTIEICSRPQTQQNVAFISNYLRQGLERIRSDYSDFFTGIRQCGVVMGLEFAVHPEAAIPVMKHVYKHGVWAIFSALDPRVLQFKPGLLCDRALCDEILNSLELGIRDARKEVFS
ncbi:MAG: aminotransferase class III-fold pyridoxal phosphate-dependent enzyme [Chthoniobacterales bacterium]|nr:aminotransferase class III-fold pyridoxal phosphate-dependent enzyme [Chthoniobacterales bacterium]MCX7713713.1 aminotransferase class III-fold pyridoxal phosphate-dependent enzyme [Chthoniobacterales bacterium]